MMSSVLWLLSLPFRIVGAAAVVGALMAGLWDVWQTVSQDRLVLTPLGELWFQISADSLNLIQAGIQRGLHPAIWDPVLVTFLQLPAFLALLIFAALVLLIAQLMYRQR